MNCPACGKVLEQLTARDVTVDVCQDGCGGVWFDNFELKKFDEPHEPTEELMEIRLDPATRIDDMQRRQCPKCDNMPMQQHYFSVKHEVVVDECPACGGIWLDQGELEKIRSLFKTEEERHQAAHAAFDAEFGEELERELAENREKLAKARRFAHMLRFLCPSYYIPGKQSWGSF